MSTDLAVVAAEAATCTRCALAETRTQVVFGVGDPTASGQALRTDAEVSSLTRRPDGRQELRAYAGAEATVLRVEGRTGEVTDLAGTPTGERFEGALALRPHQIVTVALDEPEG